MADFVDIKIKGVCKRQSLLEPDNRCRLHLGLSAVAPVAWIKAFNDANQERRSTHPTEPAATADRDGITFSCILSDETVMQGFIDRLQEDAAAANQKVRQTTAAIAGEIQSFHDLLDRLKF
jgi:hypothetical protein